MYYLTLPTTKLQLLDIVGVSKLLPWDYGRGAWSDILKCSYLGVHLILTAITKTLGDDLLA